MKYKFVIALLLLFFFSSNGFSYTRVYLMSDVTVSSEDVKVSDISMVDGDNADFISDMIIPPELYIDKIIDNKRLYDFLNASQSEKVFVFGTGVKVKHNFKNFKNTKSSVKPPLIKRGDVITLSVRKNGIIIELKGKALSDGGEKDEVDFKLSSGKVLKGKIISSSEADVSL